jgi:hypothetical protein
MQKVNIHQPDMYQALQIQLWNLFSPELLRKQLVEALPKKPLEQTSLSHKKIFIDSETLLLLLDQSTLKKPVQIDLTYQHNLDELETSLNTQHRSASVDSESSSLPSASEIANFQTPSITPRQLARAAAASTVHTTDDSWALGGVAGKKLSHYHKKK